MDIQALCDMVAKKIASMLAGKNEEEMRAVMQFRKREVNEPILIGAKNAPKVILKTADGLLYAVDMEVARSIPKIKTVMDENNVKEGEQVPHTLHYSTILENILEWVQHSKGKDNPPPEDDGDKKEKGKQDFQTEFMAKFADLGDLFEMISQARHLEMWDLVELLYQKLKSLIEGKTNQEIKAEFNLPKEFTDERIATMKLFLDIESSGMRGPPWYLYIRHF